MKKTWLKAGILLSGIAIAIVSFTGVYKPIEKGNYMNQDTSIVITVVSKMGQPEVHKYSVSQKLLLIFENSRGIYKDIEVTPGTWYSVGVGSKIGFDVQRWKAREYENKDYTFPGVYYLISIASTIAIIILISLISYMIGVYKKLRD